MDTIHYMHHPEQIPVKPRELERNGFAFPFNLVVLGYSEFRSTGRYPNPLELAKRINPQFVADINYLSELIDRAKPKQDDTKNEGR